MRSIQYTQYGPPEVLQLRTIPKPTPKADEVLVRVYATTVTSTEACFRRANPFFVRLFTGLFRPKLQTLGEELAGEVVAVGSAVTKFKPGDRVFGTAGPTFGANADYVCVSQSGVLAPMPANLSYEQAASCVDGVLTALPFLRDTGQLQAGQRVLIYGASGSVGAAAVQVAAQLGAEVTGVCSGTNLQLVESLGARRVIDYTRQEFTALPETYDIIFDAVGKASFAQCKKALVPKGIFLEAGMGVGLLVNVLWSRLVGGKKLRIAATGLRPPSERRKDLELLRDWLESGQLKPVIDRCYPLERIVDAHRYVDKGHKKGNVVISLNDVCQFA